jgi:hypothetical protein
MSSDFPQQLDSFVNPTADNYLNSPSHAGQHSNVNDAIANIEAKLGIDGLSWINVVASGATGLGVVDETPVIQPLIDNAPQMGVQLFFPTGKFKCNLEIFKSNIHIVGCGGSTTSATANMGGTILKPYDLTKPVLTIGNGTDICSGITWKGIILLGDDTTATSDGIKIDGAYFLHADDFSILYFGGNGIVYGTSGVQPTAHAFFSNFNIRWCHKAGFKATFPSTAGYGYVTAPQMVNCQINSNNSYGADACAIYSAGVEIFITNCYIDSNDGAGLRLYPVTNVTYGNQMGKITGANMEVDISGGGQFCYIDLTSAESYAYAVTGYLKGGIGGNDYVEFKDGGKITWGTSFSLPYQTRINWPFVDGAIQFATGLGTAEENETISDDITIYGSAGNLRLNNKVGHIILTPEASSYVKIATLAGGGRRALYIDNNGNITI